VKRQLAGQFLGEVFAMTIVASVIAMLASWQLMPIVNSYSEKNLTVFDNLVFWTMLVTIIIVTTVLAGSYPSLILSSFKPIDSLKNSTKSMVKGNGLRQALVIFQFVISVALIASTLIVLDHLKFLRNKELGFDKDQVLVVHRANQATKDQVLNIEGVSHASFSNLIPGEGNTGRTIFNGWNTTDQQVVMGQVVVDHDYIELYGLELIAGRRFDREIPSDLTEGFIINETALTKLGYSSAAEAVGGKLWLDEDWGGKKGRIIGVLKDFHYNGVNSPILPFSMFMDPRAKRSLSVKIKSENIQHVLQQVEEAFKSTVPDMTFEFSFLDESFDRQYRSEDHFMTIFSFFAAVGIAIGMLGLYGLAMFMAEQRSKEVGIRKILGATEMNIAGLLTVSFMKLISISFIIAVPLAWISMEQWLERFPFRENIDPSIFLITGGTVSLITFLSVSYQAIKAALINPVKTLRSE